MLYYNKREYRDIRTANRNRLFLKFRGCMKKKTLLTILIITCVITFAFGLIGCTHHHRFSTSWTSDSSYHWHVARCKHKNEITGYALHDFGKWVTAVEPKDGIDGEERRTCVVCGYVESRIMHSFSDNWSQDSVNHWKESICEHKNEIGYKDKHSFGDWVIIKNATETENGERERSCAVCDYKETESIDKLPHSHIYSSEWTYDSDYHWHNDICGHGTVRDRELHDVDELGRCVICNNVIGTEGLLYEMSDNGYVVTGIEDKLYPETIVIPPTYNGKRVVAIGDDAFTNYSFIKKVIMHEGIKKIGQGAFFGCNYIEKIVLPNGVESIGQVAFRGLRRLTEITIPDSVTVIESEAFEACSALHTVIIGKGVMSIGVRVFNGCSSLFEIYYKGSEADWAKIDINTDYNDVLISTKRYYYSEYKPVADGNYWHYGEEGVTIIKWS